MAKPTQLQFGDFPAQSPVMEQQDEGVAEEQLMPLMQEIQNCDLSSSNKTKGER